MRRSLERTTSMRASLKLLASTAVVFSTMLSLAHALDSPDGAKGYFKDKVSTAHGNSKGVAPTKKPASEPNVAIGRREGIKHEITDESASALIIRAWEALNKKDKDAVLVYTRRCIELYETEAKKQQQALNDFAPYGSEATNEALNNVAVAYFIRGEFYKYIKDWQNARASYEEVVNEFSFAQYWDPRGWWWKPAEISKGEIEKLDSGYYERMQ